jgi:hypothetical protein
MKCPKSSRINARQPASELIGVLDFKGEIYTRQEAQGHAAWHL